jgi:hypothetical protein
VLGQRLVFHEQNASVKAKSNGVVRSSIATGESL